MNDTLTPEELRRYRSEHTDNGYIPVDYTGFLDCSNILPADYEKMDEMYQEIKVMAAKFNIAVQISSQRRNL